MRILLVEDDPQLRRSVARGLREAGYEVDEAVEGSAAFEMASGGSYGCIILDILLPERDGIEVCRALRNEQNWVPILMLTALDGVDHRIRGLDAGADDYLPKPFDFGELLARVRALTRRPFQAKDTTIRVADLTIDTKRRTVRRRKREIRLTVKEFDLLVHLARHAGEVVTRDDLMATVWSDSQAHSNVIDVYASRLRKKIDTGESVPLFATHRGIGYLIEVPEQAADATESIDDTGADG